MKAGPSNNPIMPQINLRKFFGRIAVFHKFCLLVTVPRTRDRPGPDPEIFRFCVVLRGIAGVFFAAIGLRGFVESCRYDDVLRMGAGSEIRAAKLELHPFARSFKKNPRAMPPLWEYEVFITL